MKLRFLESETGRRVRRALADTPDMMLVGGAVRDALLDVDPVNLDLWAHDPAAARAALGMEFGAPHAGATRWDAFRWDHLPLPLRLDSGSRDLEANLRSRDFTVNAMALPLRGAAEVRLVDPLHGALDVADRRLRPVVSNSCEVDPTRWLRAGRLAATRNLRTDISLKMAAERARARQPLLHGVSTLVRRSELLAALSCPHRAEGLRWMHEVGLLGELVAPWAELAARRDPDLGGRAPDEFSIACVDALHHERWAAVLEPALLQAICRRLDEPVAAGLGGWTLTALALWLRRLAPVADVAADLGTLALHGLGFPFEELRAVSRLVLARNWLDQPGPLGPGGLEAHAAVADLCVREALHGVDSPQLREAGECACRELPAYLPPAA
ncbi:MAG: CCA tRNA nucleotidyltransferase [Candidatus Eisenbacteria bacterium]|nr:CCA tRNA nucleotidyltransferase [Candidatus Eisenbacteria bacterium]